MDDKRDLDSIPVQLIRLTEVCDMTGLAPSTIRRYAEQGKFPRGRKLSARLTVWDRHTVVTWLEKIFD